MTQSHSFHVPVMGTGFTIDSPLKVARYGISSTLSLVDDKLIEQMRRHHSRVHGLPCDPIRDDDEDARARRITAYLDLLQELVARQVRRMREEPFDGRSDLCRHFEWMEDACRLKRVYRRMMQIREPALRQAMEGWLRDQVRPGRIEVNIMTKADLEYGDDNARLARKDSHAMAALRGFALSRGESSIVFSAGLNLHLYGYAGEFDGFYPDAQGRLEKKVTLKVSDFRSAQIQAKVLAKKGIWVSEYRIESGLNCGGHAFATDGQLMGPILEDFKEGRHALRAELFEYYARALSEKKGLRLQDPPPVRVTYQGGVGTSAEHRFLLRHYELDSVGWGTPFLLVPEVTNVDPDTLERLARAGSGDIVLSRFSPLGVPFYVLNDSASERARRARIDAGRPGSPCVNKYLRFNQEFGEPLCVASSAYQRRKILELDASGVTGQERRERFERIVEKSCICRDLGDGALAKTLEPGDKKALHPAVCPGPNLAFFDRIATLAQMIDHIYGRGEKLSSPARPHVFVNELKLYAAQLARTMADPAARADAIDEFKQNLCAGIRYYRGLLGQMTEELGESLTRLGEQLERLEEEILSLRAGVRPLLR